MNSTYFYFAIFLQFVSFASMSNGNYENNVVFHCGRPSMFYLNGIWLYDYNQNCIKDEMGIVSFCRQKFPTKKIISAEPAIEKSKFFNWCDFDGKNCNVKLFVRPFKCLEANVQSDNLVVPENCLFGHLGGNTNCKVYKEWVTDARKHCAKRPGWEVRSFGMLFQCGKSSNRVRPMFFMGVEFVCCPTDVKTNSTEENKNSYRPYIVNGVLETEDDENQRYKTANRKLKQRKIEWKKRITANFINGENSLKKFWWTDPQVSRFKEDSLIAKFKSEYSGMEYISNDEEEDLLRLHVERMNKIFMVKVNIAMRQLENAFQKNGSDGVELRDSMIKVLDLLMLRKQDLLKNRLADRRFNSILIPTLDEELKVIERNVTDLFNSLDKVPQYKESVKQYLIMHIMKKYPRSAEQTDPDNDQSGKDGEMNQIISEHRHQEDSSEGEENPKLNVHFNLGLHDKDQNGHHGHTRQNSGHNPLPRAAMDKDRLLFILLMVLLTIVGLIMLSGIIIARNHFNKIISKHNHRRLQLCTDQSINTIHNPLFSTPLNVHTSLEGLTSPLIK